MRHFSSFLKFLLIGFILFQISCASYTKSFEPKEKTVETFTPDYLKDFQEATFKISIEAFENHFGGIMVAKKLEKNHYRFAFLNEFGGKMMDFEIQNRELKLNYAVEQLDRKIILNMLEKDFAMLFSEKVLVKNEFRMLEVEKFSGNKNLYYELNSNEELTGILLAKTKEEVRIYLKNSSKPLPEIQISHGKLPIKIYLHLLENE